jgi:predicted nucleic acid-binding protein
MLYLDSSVLAKRYSDEKGSRAVRARFQSGEKIFTSMLSFAEVQSSIARKFRDEGLGAEKFHKLRENFMEDWLFSLNVLNMDASTMSELPRLVEKFSLRAGDAIQLSAACWLRDKNLSRTRHNQRAETVEFGVSDRHLAKIAEECGFKIFNPEGHT